MKLFKRKNEKEKPIVPKTENITDKELKSTKNVLLKTTETELVLTPCRVNDDHTLAYEKAKKLKTIKIMPGRKAHTLVIPLHALLPSRMARLFAPRTIRFRTFTAQEEGEITHDPNVTHFDPELEMRLESVLKLAATASKADVAANVMAGMKGKKHWSEYIPYIVIGVIVFLFLFAFQIAPALK